MIDRRRFIMADIAAGFATRAPITTSVSAQSFDDVPSDWCACLCMETVSLKASPAKAGDEEALAAI